MMAASQKIDRCSIKQCRAEIQVMKPRSFSLMYSNSNKCGLKTQGKNMKIISLFENGISRIARSAFGLAGTFSLVLLVALSTANARSLQANEKAGKQSGAQRNVETSSMGLDDARHLLSRVGFAATNADIQAFAKMTRFEAADQLVKGATSVAVTPVLPWVDELPLSPAKRQIMSREATQVERRRNNERTFELRDWWFREMLNTPSPLTEKMTLFWHNHFATSQQKVHFAPLIYRQNTLLRRNALGNFSNMLHEMSRDPAMLIYLDGANSRKQQPNENFGREVMELFTLGEGNYTEKDIKEVARAFTGWSIDRETGQFMFRRAVHDYGDKTIFGKTGNFEGDQVLDMILKRPETAQFITGKLWREFVSTKPDEKEVKQLAAIFQSSGYNIGKLMRLILSSDAFYALDNRATLIKSPVEFVVGTLKTFDIETPNLRPFVLTAALLGQNVFAPPNVKGWPGGEAWINTATLLGRKQLLDRLFRNEDRMEVTMRAMDDMAARMGEQGQMQGPPGKEGRMARQMERSMDGIKWNLNAWTQRFVDQRGPNAMQDMTRLVLAMPPQTASPAPMLTLASSAVDPAKNKPADWARQLVADPAYQLK